MRESNTSEDSQSTSDMRRRAREERRNDVKKFEAGMEKADEIMRLHEKQQAEIAEVKKQMSVVQAKLEQLIAERTGHVPHAPQFFPPKP